MLQSMRSGVSSIFIKILLGVIILSFALWGIGDVFRGRGDNTEITVGDVSFSKPFVNQMVAREVERMKKGSSANSGLDEIFQYLAQQQVHQQLVNDTLLKLETERLALGISDEEIADFIRNDPANQDETGQFSRQRYDANLRNAGASERRYVSMLKEDIATQRLVDTIIFGVIVPPVLLEQQYKYLYETRDVSVLELPLSLVKTIADPDAATLRDYYEQHKDQFKAPEFRSASYIELEPSHLLDEAAIDAERVKDAYTERLADYTTEAQYVLGQWLFADEATAQAAYAELMEDNAANVSTDYVPLGDVELAALPESAHEVVKALKTGDISAPVQSELGYHIFKAEQVVAGKVSSFDEVKHDVRYSLAMEEAEDALYALSTQVEDAIAAGDSLDAIAKMAGVTVKKIGTINRQGFSPDGVEVSALPYQAALNSIFSTDEGDMSDLLQDSGSYYLFKVDGVTPERIKALEEVQGTVRADWMEEQRVMQLKLLAEEARTKYSSLAEIASAYELAPVSYNRMDRKGSAEGKAAVSPDQAQDIFALQIGQLSKVLPQKNGGLLLAAVTAVHAPEEVSEKDKEALEMRLIRELGMERMEAYVQSLHQRYPVTMRQE